MKDLIGREFGHYRITAIAGQGGMAVVYKAYQASMDRYVAIKVLPPYFAHDPNFAARFRQEGRTAGRAIWGTTLVGWQASCRAISAPALEGNPPPFR